MRCYLPFGLRRIEPSAAQYPSRSLAAQEKNIGQHFSKMITAISAAFGYLARISRLYEIDRRSAVKQPCRLQLFSSDIGTEGGARALGHKIKSLTLPDGAVFSRQRRAWRTVQKNKPVRPALANGTKNSTEFSTTWHVAVPHRMAPFAATGTASAAFASANSKPYLPTFQSHEKDDPHLGADRLLLDHRRIVVSEGRRRRF